MIVGVCTWVGGCHLLPRTSSRQRYQKSLSGSLILVKKKRKLSRNTGEKSLEIVGLIDMSPRDPKIPLDGLG